MESKCTACAAGPRGIEGHSALFVETIAPARMYFRCSACKIHWIRRYAGDSTFSWAMADPKAVASDQGMLIPRR
jgi:hypothetical protein